MRLSVRAAEIKGHNTTLQNRNLQLLRRCGILNAESETNAQSPGEEQPVRVCASSAVYVSIAVPQFHRLLAGCQIQLLNCLSSRDSSSIIALPTPGTRKVIPMDKDFAALRHIEEVGTPFVYFSPLICTLHTSLLLNLQCRM